MSVDFVLSTLANVLCGRHRFRAAVWRCSNCDNQAWRGIGMPQSGETNQRLRVYKGLGGSREIVASKDDVFPDRPNQPITTIWEPIVDSNIVRFDKTPPDTGGSRLAIKSPLLRVGAQRKQAGRCHLESSKAL